MDGGICGGILVFLLAIGIWTSMTDPPDYFGTKKGG